MLLENRPAFSLSPREIYDRMKLNTLSLQDVPGAIKSIVSEKIDRGMSLYEAEKLRESLERIVYLDRAVYAERLDMSDVAILTFLQDTSDLESYNSFEDFCESAGKYLEIIDSYKKL